SYSSTSTRLLSSLLFLYNHPAIPEISTLSLHDALPISLERDRCNAAFLPDVPFPDTLHLESDLATALAASRNILVVVPSHVFGRSEEHTSELQSRFDLVCRLLLEKKKI